MDPAKHELQVVSNMIMCGDHPSITKTELNAKDPKPKEEEKPREVSRLPSRPRISPTVSSHAGAEARRRRSLELAERDADAPASRALVHAAVGSFRWPPYLLCVWVLVLVVTHALHCLVAALEGALPSLRNLCQYCRAWTEASWRGGAGGARPLALAAATGALYALLGALLALRAAARWALEPLHDADPEYDQLAAAAHALPK